MKKIRNLTGQPLTVYVENQAVATLPSQGRVFVRANYEYDYHVDVEGYPIPVLTTGAAEEVDGLPDQEDDILLVVTGLVCGLYPERGDLLAPARVVKEKGKIVGCRAFMSQADEVIE